MGRLGGALNFLSRRPGVPCGARGQVWLDLMSLTRPHGDETAGAALLVLVRALLSSYWSVD